MAVWELALVIFAITYMGVNTVSLIVSLKLMNKMEGVMNKSFKMVEKMIDHSEKAIDEMFDDEL